MVEHSGRNVGCGQASMLGLFVTAVVCVPQHTLEVQAGRLPCRGHQRCYFELVCTAILLIAEPPLPGMIRLCSGCKA
jgi:hypothetical protein